MLSMMVRVTLQMLEALRCKLEFHAVVGACTFELVGPGVSIELGQEVRRLERAQGGQNQEESEGHNSGVML